MSLPEHADELHVHRVLCILWCYKYASRDAKKPKHPLCEHRSLVFVPIGAIFIGANFIQ